MLAGQPLTPAEEEEFRVSFGWLARLTQSPSDSPEREQMLAAARRTTVVWQGLLFGGIVGCGVGVGLLILLARRLRQGRLRSGLAPPSGCGGIYAETFALWLALFFVGNEVAARLPRPSQPLGWGIALMLGSLVVLLYPLLRGVSWGQLRRDIGLTWGDGPARGALYGLGTYLAALPVVLLSLLLLNALLTLLRRLTGQAEPFGPGSTPFHPAVEALLRGSAWQRRWWCWRQPWWRRWWRRRSFADCCTGIYAKPARLSTTSSVFFSGVLSGLIFALIHPQGLLAVPLLTMLITSPSPWYASGAAACCRRWWRHGINNGMVALVVIGMAG